jgi:hypothetical protein
LICCRSMALSIARSSRKRTTAAAAKMVCLVGAGCGSLVLEFQSLEELSSFLETVWFDHIEVYSELDK